MNEIEMQGWELFRGEKWRIYKNGVKRRKERNCKRRRESSNEDEMPCWKLWREREKENIK